MRFFHKAFHFIHLSPGGKVTAQLINFYKKNIVKNLRGFKPGKLPFSAPDEKVSPCLTQKVPAL
jgi:hypothetical protein